MFLPHKHPSQILYISKGMRYIARVDVLRPVCYLPYVGFAVLHLKKIRYGEYFIPENTSMFGVIKVIWSNKQVMRKISIPEGLSVAQILALINANQYLQGDYDKIPEEGTLISGTYMFARDTSRTSLLQTITNHATYVHESLWKEPKAWQNMHDWITFASLLEKEGYDYEDKVKIASVIMRRLRANMRLQIDATLLYIKTKGLYNQKLSWDDLRNRQSSPDSTHLSRYNTYLHYGLPPGPITNPSKESLEVAINPAPGKYLYYRMVGSKHVFSETFQKHKSLVKRGNLSQN